MGVVVIFAPNQTVVFFGDSITDHGRDREAPASMGDGYVSRIVEGLREWRNDLHFVNAGISGDTTRNLLARLETDVLSQHPDWVSIAIGVNDVWRSFGVGDTRDAVGIVEFEANYRELIRKILETGARLVLVEPFVIEPDHSEPFKAQVDAYAQVVEKLARDSEAVFVPFQRAFDRISDASANMWSEDRVHPNAAGVDLMAEEFLRTVDPEGFGQAAEHQATS